MTWPYRFVNLSQDEIALRRELLDRYGAYAQLSALVPVLVYQLYRLAVWVSSERKNEEGYTAVPSTPGAPSRKKSRQSSTGALAKQWRSLVWWLEGEMLPGWGLKGHWIAAGLWASWLMFLCVHKTGDDYMHITKRFGIVAASQFPVHYMLSMKSLYSPLAIAFQTSHEQLNPFHRLSGRILYSFLFLHASFYLNFFIQNGFLVARLTSLVPFLGALSITLLSLSATTSLDRVRRWSYRVFFIFHLTIAVSILPILFFHAKPLRFFTVEALALFVFDLIGRKLDTATGFATITQVPHTKLLKLAVPIPASKLRRFDVAPGQHVYLSIPPQSVPIKTSLPSIHEFLFNPFTVADVSLTEILLVLRTLHGPTTTTLKDLTNISKARPGINIEGPYGVARRFPNFAAEFDRILLVAGGVGSTFIVPIYLKIAASMTSESYSGNRVEMIWAMRSLAEAGWVTETENAKLVEKDDRVKIYITGAEASSLALSAGNPEDGSVEMGDLGSTESRKNVSGGYARPDLQNIVDNTFRQGAEERVAVLVCGPTEMARELRAHVGRWIAKGRDVWWHDESFGW